MRLITVCGHFGGNQEKYDGQTVKTRNVYDALEKKFGKEEVLKIDTYGWKKNPFKLLIKSIKSEIFSKNIIILPAHKGVRVFIPLFNIFNIFFKRKIHYIVIGAWISDLINNKKFLLNQMKKIDYIYVETYKLKKKLNNQGLNNVYVLKNFKQLEQIEIGKVNLNPNKDNFKCCIFSRIEKEKGVGDAINVVERLNKENYNIKLDIFGKIKKEYEKEFYDNINKNENVKYHGIVEPDRSTEILYKYDLLLFPTRYKTEGIPGTIIDAYFSGLPILSSKWENFSEVIEEGETGIGFTILDMTDFYEKFKFILENIDILIKMKKNCLIKSEQYKTDNVLKTLYERIER